MKVLAIGGSGGMGRYAVKTLLKLDICEKIIIGDIDEEKARNFSEECGLNTSWRKVDVSDHLELKKSIEQADVVMNTAGPFYRYGVSVLQSSIDNGCHYFDINDDWEPTLQMLDLDRKAKSAGISAIVGMGASPGMSNLLAVKAIGELDQADEIYTGWALDSAKPEMIGPEPSAATVHGIHQLTGTILAYIDGKYQKTRPRKKLKIDYPGIGTHSVWTIGHPEAVTLPRYFPDLTKSINVFTAAPINVFGIKAIAKLVDMKLISLRTAAKLAEKVEGPSDPYHSPEKIIQEMIENPNSQLPPLFAYATGKKNNTPARSASMILSAPEGGMGGATGVPLAVGIALLNENKIQKHGVFAPEGIFDPDDFFNKLAPLCTPKKEGIFDLVLTTTSCKHDNTVNM